MRSAPRALAFFFTAALAGHAATLEITVKDARDAPVEDAVFWAMPKPGAAPARKRDASIAQRDKTFIPLVSVIQAGTTVHFPNQDPIRHHVYSFSTPKPFEIKLYAGTPTPPTVVFDKPGEVVLGCNIHDHMIAYIYVVESPWFAKSGKDGKARIEGLPPGDYDLNIVHYDQVSSVAPVALRARGDETLAVPLTVAIKPPAPPIPRK